MVDSAGIGEEKEMNFTADWFSHNIPTWERVVAPHLRALERPSVLEIGSHEGRSAVWLLSNFPELRLMTVDPWEDEAVRQRFMDNCEPYNHRLYSMALTSREALRLLRLDFYDMVYVDGLHTAPAVLYDAVNSFELLKVGGLLVFDDYAGGAGVAPAVDAFREIYGDKLKAESIDYQAIYRKVAA